MRAQRPNFRREINCDFFRVEIGHGGANGLLDVCNGIQRARPNASDRNLEVNDGFLRLYGWHSDGESGGGALLRLRTINNASIAMIHQDELRDLQLGRDEALAEYFCFAYYHEFRTLVLHRNRDAGGYGRLAMYLEEITGLRPVTFAPVLNTDALSRLERMQTVTVAELKIALPENLAAYETDESGVGGVLRFARHTGAATISATISMDHSRRPLLGVVKDIWRNVVVNSRDSVKAARVRGRSDELADGMLTIDLINDRMQERVDLDTREGRPSLDDFDNALRTAYLRRRDEIRYQFDIEAE